MHLLRLFAIVSSLLLPHDVRGFSPASGRRLTSSPSRAAHQPSSPSPNIMALHQHYLSAGFSEATWMKPTSLHSSTGGDGGDAQSEIAALEERLRQLKQSQEIESSASAVADEEPAVAAAPDEEPAVAAVQDEEPAATAVLDEDEAMLEGESDDSVMFSERWKEAKDDYVTKQQEDSLGGIAKIGAGLAFVVVLGLFSQVPVGEESLQRYQDVKGTSSRIDLGDLNPVQIQ